MSLLTNLLAWYKLNEAAGNSRADSSGNGNTLAETGGAVSQVTGLIGSAAGFTDAAGHYLKLASALFTSGSFSFSAWINPTDFTLTNWYYLAQGATTTARQFLRTNTTGNVIFGVNNVATLTSSGTLSTSAWNHIAGTYDGATARLYLNGKLDSGTAKTVSYTGLNVFCLGSNDGTGSTTPDGALDLAGVWGRQLTDGGVSVGNTAGGEIATLYNGGAGLDYPFSSGGGLLLGAAFSLSSNQLVGM